MKKKLWMDVENKRTIILADTILIFVRVDKITLLCSRAMLAL